jgi:hypothetical protein
MCFHDASNFVLISALNVLILPIFLVGISLILNFELSVAGNTADFLVLYVSVT